MRNTRGPFTEHVRVAGPVALEAGWTIVLGLQTRILNVAILTFRKGNKIITAKGVVGLVCSASYCYTLFNTE